MKRMTALGLLCLGLILTMARPSEARPRCRPGWDQGYGCYFAAPYVGTGRYCAGYGYNWVGPSSYYGPAASTVSINPATGAPYGAMAPAPAPAATPVPAAAPTAPPAPAPAPSK